MLGSNAARGLAAATVCLFAAYAVTAQEVKNLPPGATAHSIYFPTSGFALDPKDQEQIRDVAGLIRKSPGFRRHNPWQDRFSWLCWILTSAYHNGAPMPYSRLSCMTTKCQRAGYLCAGQASACHSHQLPIKRRKRRTGWPRLS